MRIQSAWKSSRRKRWCWCRWCTSSYSALSTESEFKWAVWVGIRFWAEILCSEGFYVTVRIHIADVIEGAEFRVSTPNRIFTRTYLWGFIHNRCLLSFIRWLWCLGLSRIYPDLIKLWSECHFTVFTQHLGSMNFRLEGKLSRCLVLGSAGHSTRLKFRFCAE